MTSIHHLFNQKESLSHALIFTILGSMSQGEIVISVILIFLTYYLYQIARQLSFLTGKRLKMPKFTMPKPEKGKKKEEPIENLPN